MTIAIILLSAIIAIAFLALLVGLLSGLPQETLEEQAECIRKDQEEREKKKREKEEKRRRKKT